MMDIKTLLEDEIDILYTTLDRLKIYDIRLSHTKDGRIFAKDADSQWTGKNFYKFLLNDAIVYNHGNYYGGISLDGMMFKIPKMYAPVTDETGRITAFRQMREKDFSRGQPQKKPEKKPSIREQLAKKPEQHTAAKPPAKRKDLER